MADECYTTSEPGRGLIAAAEARIEHQAAQSRIEVRPICGSTLNRNPNPACERLRWRGNEIAAAHERCVTKATALTHKRAAQRGRRHIAGARPTLPFLVILLIPTRPSGQATNLALTLTQS